MVHSIWLKPYHSFYGTPGDGTIDADIPISSSPLRIEKFSEQVEAAYVSRYKGLPPHTD